MSLPFLSYTDINQKITSNYYFNELTVNILNVATIAAGSLQLTNTTNQILFGSSGVSGTYISVPRPTVQQVITLPDGGTGTSNFIISNSATAQNINSQLNVNSIVTQSVQLTNATNQTLFGSSGASGTYVSVPRPAQAQVITVPDGGTGTSNFIISNSATAQNINSQLNTNGGVTYLTSGGTPTLLNYYEQGTISLTLSGIWAVDQTGTCYFTRIGNVVTVFFPHISANANSAFYIKTQNNTLPTRLIPTQGGTPLLCFYPFFVFDNGVSTDGTIEYNTVDNNFIFGSSAGGVQGTFSGLATSGQSGFYPNSITYLLA